MASEQAPHVQLDGPAAGLDTTSTPAQQSSNGSTLQNAKDSVLSTAQSTMSAIQEHPVTQNVKDTVVNGPVGESVKDQGAKTSAEFKDLANARTTPEQPAATGQPLTHYHSAFYRLLSWKNPRATGITFAVNILLIFASRYLPVVRYTFKALYIAFGITAAAEIAGKTVLGDGLATRIRPRKYFVIPKESLERFLDDVEQLLNFFVIEFQRVLFAENLWATLLAFVSAFVSYFLIKWVPLWGLTLISTIALYVSPLIYIKNKEAIDAQLSQASELINQQTTQLKDLAAHHTKGATDTVKSYAGDYSKLASDYIGQSRQKISGVNTSTNGSPSTVKASDFPAAPKEAPVANAEIPKAAPQPEPAF